MPFSSLELSAEIPPPAAYPKELQTLGDHLKKARLDRGLLLKEAASELGVSLATLIHWEKGHHTPETRGYGRIVSWLGYDPAPQGETLGERIITERRRRGLSQKDLARALGIDQATLWAWETGKVKKPYPRFTKMFEEFVGGN